MNAGRHLDLDPEVLRAGVDRVPFAVRHRLAGHPLFEPPRLVALARLLGPDAAEYNAGDVPLSLEPARTPRTGLTVEETIERIEECRSWLVLKRVERDSEYAALLDACLDEIQEAAGVSLAGMRQREGFIFVTSPRSTTPYHLDPECNFLLQIRGDKVCRVAPRSSVPEEDLERRFSGAHRNLAFGEAAARRAVGFPLFPGDGVHIPMAAPHWVLTGDGVSVSFSITFRTATSERDSALYRVNAHLRRLGLTPAPVGSSRPRDALKHGAVRAARRVLRPLRWR